MKRSAAHQTSSSTYQNIRRKNNNNSNNNNGYSNNNHHNNNGYDPFDPYISDSSTSSTSSSSSSSINVGCGGWFSTIAMATSDAAIFPTLLSSSSSASATATAVPSMTASNSAVYTSIPSPSSSRRHQHQYHHQNNSSRNQHQHHVRNNDNNNNNNHNKRSSNKDPQQQSTSESSYTSEAEALMVKELTQLSLKERTGIEEEIHGVGDVIVETPELIQRSLAAFQEALVNLVMLSNRNQMNTNTNTTANTTNATTTNTTIVDDFTASATATVATAAAATSSPSVILNNNHYNNNNISGTTIPLLAANNGGASSTMMSTSTSNNNTSAVTSTTNNTRSLTTAYELAMTESPTFVNDPKLRLKFLRADKFDAIRAARRFVKYFDAIMEFFGPSKLCKEITWDDLTDNDRNAVETCSFWVDKCDQRGRRLAWIFPQYEIYHHYTNQIRNVWYQIMKALKDEETQRNGFVKVVYMLGGTKSRMKKSQSMDTELFFKGITLIFEVLPFRLAALHYCYEDPKIRPVIATVQYVIGKAGRLRFRAHYGSHVECQYALMTFGIPRKHIPISDAGEVPASIDSFYSYLEDLRQEEEKEQQQQQQQQQFATLKTVTSNNNNKKIITSSSGDSSSNMMHVDVSSMSSILNSTSSNFIRGNVSPRNNRNGDDANVNATFLEKTPQNNNDNINTSACTGNVDGANASENKSSSNKSSGNNSDNATASSNEKTDDSGAITPRSNDVLLGRGKPFQEFPGNLRLAILVDRYRDKYMEAGRCDKAIISQHLVDQIKKADGRFLKKVSSDGPWIEVTDEVARDKVGHGFRTKPRKIFNPSAPLGNVGKFGSHHQLLGSGGGGGNSNNNSNSSSNNGMANDDSSIQSNIRAAAASIFGTNLTYSTSSNNNNNNNNNISHNNSNNNNNTNTIINMGMLPDPTTSLMDSSSFENNNNNNNNHHQQDAKRLRKDIL